MSAKGTKWSEAQKLRWSKKCLDTKVNNLNKKPLTDEERKILSKKSFIHNKKYWTEEKRKEQSLRMKKIVQKNPDSYNKKNISGRVKLYDVNSTDGMTKVKGTWELKVANWLNDNNVKWTNNIKPFEYYWNNDYHFYYPDFYLIDFDKFIEVKGYETERDRIKWKTIDELIILKKKEINSLDNCLKIYCGIEQ